MTVPVAEDLSIDHILRAQQRITDLIVQTPVLESPALNNLVNGRLLFKAETLQKTGSFKFRGACHFISTLSQDEQRRGVVAYSSGNHAQAVAYAAQLFNIHATIVMPADAPRIKIENTRSYGADVILYDRMTESRESIAEAVVREKGAILLPPYDHPHTIVGQGTLALELCEQVAQLNTRLDALLVPCSGGGLAAGCALAMKARSPKTLLYTVEPEGYDDTAQSFKAGKRVAVSGKEQSLSDALMMTIPGKITFPINAEAYTGGFVVTDTQVRHAMAMAFQHLRLVVEPGGAVGLAAALSGQLDCQGKTTGIVLSGGNVDPEVFRSVLS
jgi:threonine dehydratase